MQGRRRGRHGERKEPPFPNYFKLFCWMTDFISDQSRREKPAGRGGFVVGGPWGKEAELVAMGENMVQTNVTPNSSYLHLNTAF